MEEVNKIRSYGYFLGHKEHSIPIVEMVGRF